MVSLGTLQNFLNKSGVKQNVAQRVETITENGNVLLRSTIHESVAWSPRTRIITLNLKTGKINTKILSEVKNDTP